MRRKSNGKGEVVDFAFKFWEKMAGRKAQPQPLAGCLCTEGIRSRC